MKYLAAFAMLLAGSAAAIAQPEMQRLELGRMPMSPVLSRDGKMLFVLNSGRENPSVSVVDTASLREISRTPVDGAWLGLALAADGKRLYVSGGSKAAVHEFAVAGDGKLTLSRTMAVEQTNWIGDVQVSPDGRLIFATAPLQNGVVVINAQSGRVIERWATGRRPYRIVFHPDGKSFFVSSWADGSVYQHRMADGEKMGVARLAQQPMDMVLSSKPVDVDEEGESKPTWKHRLFVAAANTNSVYILGILESGELRLVDTVNIALSPRHPLGMTPLALSLSGDEKTLYVACADANAVAVVSVAGAKAVLKGHLPAGTYPTGVRELGTGDRVAIFSDGLMQVATGLEQLPAYTRQVRAATPYSDATLDVAVNPGNIRNIVYIVCDGRLEGPNGGKLAGEFSALGRVSGMPAATKAESLYWASAAIVPSFVRMIRPTAAAAFGDPASIPAAGFLWTNAISAGMPVKNYGFLVEKGAIREAGVARYTNLKYAGVDAAGVSDVARAAVFLEDLKAAGGGLLPRLTVMRLAGAADQDAALGAIVEGISKSSAWPSTAIFVASLSEGTRGFVISPYTRSKGKTDTTAYTQTSFLRTIELLLGLRPMTQFDAAAVPISGVFQAGGDTAAYQAVP